MITLDDIKQMNKTYENISKLGFKFISMEEKVSGYQVTASYGNTDEISIIDIYENDTLSVRLHSGNVKEVCAISYEPLSIDAAINKLNGVAR